MFNNPFKGLDAFTEKDSTFFFGRDREIGNIIDKLRVECLTILYGNSGVGKSSILRAGVTPSLIKEARENIKKCRVPKLAVIIFPSFEDEYSWRKDPLIGLKKQIEKDIKKIQKDILFPNPEQSFIDSLRHWVKYLGNEEEEGELFIILDQFEDYFLYPQEDGEGTFAVEFPRAVNCRDLNVNFLISIRSDYFTKLDYFADRILNLISNRLDLKPLSEDLAREAIQKTITAYNNEKGLCGEDEIRIEVGVINRILNQIGIKKPKSIENLEEGTNSKEVKRIEASLLQIDLERLWDEEVGKDSKIIRDEIFLKLGETAGIVRELVKKRLDNLDDNQKDVTASLLHFLVTPDKHKISHTASHLRYYANEYRAEYPDLSELTDEEVLNLLKKLSDSEFRILRHREDGDCYEILHDTLSEGILAWQSNFIMCQKRKKKEQEEKSIAKFKENERSLRLEIAKKILMNLRSFKESSREDEVVALLARQAYLLNRDYEGDLLNEVDDALHRAVNIDYFSSVLHSSDELDDSDVNKLKVSSVTFFPGSKKCAAGIFNEIDRGIVQVWDLDKKENSTIVQLNVRRGVLAVAISPDAKYLAVGSSDKVVRVYNIENYPDVEPMPFPPLQGHASEVWCVAFSPDSKILASAGSEDQTVLLWDVEHLDNPPLAAFKHNDWVWSVAFRPPNGETLAVGCRNGDVYLWNPEYSLKEPLRSFNILDNSQTLNEDDKRERGEIFSVAFSLDGEKLAVGSKDKTIRIWDWIQLRREPEILEAHSSKDSHTDLIPEPKILKGHVDTIRTIAFSPNSQWLASGSNFYDRTIRLWDLQNVEDSPKSLEGHTNGVSSLSFSPDGQWLLSGSWDGRVRLWELKSPSTCRIFQKYGDSIKALTISSDGKVLASGGNDHVIKLWNLDCPEDAPVHLKGHEREVSSVVFHPQNNEILASGSYDCTVRVWNRLQPDQPLAILKGHEGEVSSVMFSLYDGDILAVGSHDGKVRVWNWHQPDMPMVTLKDHHRDRITSVAFCPWDDQVLATGSYDQTICIWKWQEKEVVGEPIAINEGGITSISFSADQHKKYLAYATNRQKVGLWDLSRLHAPRWLGPKCRHLKGISVTFNPKDSQILASGGYKGEVWLWNLQKPDTSPIYKEGHINDVLTLTFSPDGQYLASGSNGGTIRLDMVNTQKLADIVCQKVWRNLTQEEWKKYIGDIPYERICSELNFGEGVSVENQADRLRQYFEDELQHLLAGQKSLLKLIERRIIEKDPLLRGDISEEEVARKLKKPHPKGDEATYQRLEALKDSGFLEVTDKGSEPGTIKYGLSEGYREYLKLAPQQAGL